MHGIASPLALFLIDSLSNFSFRARAEHQSDSDTRVARGRIRICSCHEWSKLFDAVDKAE